MALFGFSIGQILHGAYRLVDRIGQGGTGVVFEGEQIRREQPVAIKALELKGGRATEAYDRWVVDLERVGVLDHPHVVPVLDLNELDFDHPFVVMELVRGVDLAAATTAAGGGLWHLVVLDIIKQAGSALSSTHAGGVIHGGLRPGNMLLERREAGFNVKLTDFGIHRLQRTEVAGMEDAPIGTPPFMAPEQARGASDEQDVTTDVFGLGALTYFALSGEPPLSARYLTRFIDRVCKEDPPPLSQMAPGYPEVLDRVLARSLARDQQDRYPTIDAFVLDLEAAMAMVERDPEEDKKRPLFRSAKEVGASATPAVEPGHPWPPPEPARAAEPPAVRGHEARVTELFEADEPQDEGRHLERVTEMLRRSEEVEEGGDEGAQEPATLIMATDELTAPKDELRKTMEYPSGQGGAEDAPRLRDVGLYDDEAPTVREPMRSRHHDWSMDYSATLEDVGAEGGTPSAIKRMLQERRALVQDSEGEGEDNGSEGS